MIGDKKMKIKKITHNAIIFDNGSKIDYDHKTDCCEDNYADFEQLEESAHNETFEEKLIFEQHETGFRFGNEGKMYYIPCYSEQNGYYTCEIEIYFNDEKVLSFECEVKM
jgi:hypothetical protein